MVHKARIDGSPAIKFMAAQQIEKFRFEKYCNSLFKSLQQNKKQV